MEEVNQTAGSVTTLRGELAAANLTIQVLMDRIESDRAGLAESSGVNANTLAMQTLIRKRTAELERMNQGLFTVVTERRRADRIMRQLQQISKAGGWELDVDSGSVYLTEQIIALLGSNAGEEVSVSCLCACFQAKDAPVLQEAIRAACDDQKSFDLELTIQRMDGSHGIIRVLGQPVVEAQRVGSVYGAMMDITERREAERQAINSQHLEALGRLAAGIAHEINTPTQFVSDNVRFLQGEFGNLLSIVATYSKCLSYPGMPWPDRQKMVEETLAKMDYDFLAREIPQAISQSLEGLERVASIVRAMKEFSHPGSTQKEAVDLNQRIASTIEVCRNRWKYVASLETDFAPDLPPVFCLVAELNQVVLNLIVNAADAIAEKHGQGTSKGHIAVRTRASAEMVEISISDNGTGISDENKAKIFSQFFTTKEIGKGTGQGLALCRNVIVKKHGGELTFESKHGEGTTFTIRIPRDSAKNDRAEAA